MLMAIGFVALFIVGGLSGVSHAVSPSDFQQQDTYYIVAHIHYVLFGGAIFGIFAGIYYWYPKITGKMYNELLGKIHFWLMFIGMNLTFFPMHYAGLNGMPRRIYTYAEGFGWEGMNLLATIGYFVIVISLLIFIHNFFRSIKKGEEAGHDPWDAPTLEWSISSPPPVYNFAEVPVVRGQDAYWITKREAAARGEAVPAEPHVDPDTIHMPSPSYWPLITSFGVVWIAGGLLIDVGWDYIRFPVSFHRRDHHYHRRDRLVERTRRGRAPRSGWPSLSCSAITRLTQNRTQAGGARWLTQTRPMPRRRIRRPTRKRPPPGLITGNSSCGCFSVRTVSSSAP